jgi:mono/diheme cytochrome c family protein
MDADRKNQDFQDRRRQSEELAVRAVQLASAGVPADGAVNLLRRDPLTQGGSLFGQHCAGCHNHSPAFTNGEQAADLAGFGTEQWIRDLLRKPDDPRFFGHTQLKRMTKWVKEEGASVPPEELNLIAQWLSGHPRGVPKEGDQSLFAQGYEAFMNNCNGCHTYEPAPDEVATDFPGPDFTGYGSADWIRQMIMSPDHPRRYGERNAMPVLRDLEGPAGEIAKADFSRTQKLLLGQLSDDEATAKQRRERIQQSKLAHLSDTDRELIIRWLIDDRRVVFGGEPISAPPQP